MGLAGAAPIDGTRIAVFALLTVAITLVTPLVRATPWLAPLPDPIEAYLRPAGVYAAFPLFPWAGFLFAGVLVGDLVDAVAPVADGVIAGCRCGLAVAAVCRHLARLDRVVPAGALSDRPFWHDSPTFFFIRLGVVDADGVRRPGSSSSVVWRPAPVAARDAGPLVALRLLDSHRDGLRRHRRADQANAAAVAVARRHALITLLSSYWLGLLTRRTACWLRARLPKLTVGRLRWLRCPVSIRLSGHS